MLDDETIPLPNDAEHEPGRPGWQKRLLGMNPSAAVSNADGRKYLVFTAAPWLAHSLSRAAAKRGMSRDAYLRHLIAAGFSQELDVPYDDVMSGFVPRKKHVRPGPMPTKPDSIRRQELRP
jgi:hypothetical protein